MFHRDGKVAQFLGVETGVWSVLYDDSELFSGNGIILYAVWKMSF